jgi:hypothetical protein
MIEGTMFMPEWFAATLCTPTGHVLGDASTLVLALNNKHPEDLALIVRTSPDLAALLYPSRIINVVADDGMRFIGIVVATGPQDDDDGQVDVYLLGRRRGGPPLAKRTPPPLERGLPLPALFWYGRHRG